jgi:hypothetical protein
MKLGSGILKTSIQNLFDENFHFYNSLVLTDDLAFQRTHFVSHPRTFHVYTTTIRRQMIMMTYHYNTNRIYRITSFSK